MSGGVGINGTGTPPLPLFTMTGGIIRDNEAETHGGGVEVIRGTFIMRGGEISRNRVDYRNQPSSTNMNGEGGVSVRITASFEMCGGRIVGNTATGATSPVSGGGILIQA
jgi:hypothetical protein